jgi:predicted TIM-barrel fold metal-dependent hydrolase
MSAIDIHTHAFPDEIADRAITKLEAAAHWQAVSRGKVSELLKSMDDNDIDVSCVCTIATKPDQPEGILKWCEKIRTDRIEPLPSVHPNTPDPIRWIERFAEGGFAGIKLHPMYQDFNFDDPKMDEVYAACAENGLFVQTHCGLDIAWSDDDRRAAPDKMRNVADRHPNLILVCTHMGGWRGWDEAEKYLVGAPVFLETSFSLGDLGPKRAADIIHRHGAERVMFGTDWPWASQKAELETFAQLGLTDSETRSVLYETAANLLEY